jgi:hypothetical protein
MDATTQLALRAIVRGLHQGGALGEEQTRTVMSALQAFADSERASERSVDAKALMQLSSDIGRDVGIG